MMNKRTANHKLFFLILGYILNPNVIQSMEREESNIIYVQPAYDDTPERSQFFNVQPSYLRGQNYDDTPEESQLFNVQPSHLRGQNYDDTPEEPQLFKFYNEQYKNPSENKNFQNKKELFNYISGEFISERDIFHNSEIIKSLIYEKDTGGNTFLHIIVKNNHISDEIKYNIISLLIKYGADTTEKNNNNQTALDVFISHYPLTTRTNTIYNNAIAGILKRTEHEPMLDYLSRTKKYHQARRKRNNY